MTATLRLQLLGGFHLVAGDRAVTGLESPRLQSLVARLALHAGVPQPRQQLAYLYWPDSAERQARANLRRLVYDLAWRCPTPSATSTWRGRPSPGALMLRTPSTWRSSRQWRKRPRRPR